jgi:hypothetical protein
MAMPIVQQSKIDPLRTVSELLSHLQLEGVLDGLEVPHWATGGTSVEELILALRMAGDGEWLTEVYKGHGTPEAMDKWIMAFLEGETVPTPNDLHEAMDSELPNMESVKAYFVAALPDEKERIIARLDDPSDLAMLGPQHIVELAQSMASCAVLPEDEYELHEHRCLDRTRMEDLDLLAVSLFYLGKEDVLEEFGSLGEEYAEQAKTRTAILRSRLRDLAVDSNARI